ncbi:MAG TPA: sulfite exporter TauE/SafE family protein [Methylibium sp.]|uniref:sulfite exporter TauE/SafE family protein n=1 Tax=Methylibium sp. TaxID=2067992 RepID=UPI002DB634C0|nr:sulfite exporter TauE/SafE family protein [Methylibium sp.]HEU4459949.1 sulfite exporter TauE/SafE family protein [Methylibium sp.]
MTWLLGSIIGVLMGITGAGGGVLAVPALVFGLGFSMQQAAPVALIAVSFAACVGAIEGLLRRTVRWRAAIVIAMAAFPFTALGVALAQRLPDVALRLLFIGVLTFVAWRQIVSRAPRDEAESYAPTGHVALLNPDTGRFIWTRDTWVGFVFIGGVMGFCSGLLGVSGGFVLVPLLSRYTPLGASMLVGTSLLVTAFVTAFGASASVLQGATLPWPLTAWFATSLVSGMVAGRLLVHHLPERRIRQAFLLLVIGVATALSIDVLRRLVMGP